MERRIIGHGQPVYVIAEIGINHNGSLDLAKQLIDVAKEAGCDAVKFQKRTPELCTPAGMRDKMRDTPWGYMRYLDYRKRIEFGREQFGAIAYHCLNLEIDWFCSCWDVEAVDFIKNSGTPIIKIPSAALTDRELIECARDTGKPLMLSTGMSTMEQIEAAVDLCDIDNLFLAHATSTYPCPPAEINLEMLYTLAEKFDCPIGYSGHETGLDITKAAVAMGACFVERHITLDRSMWGSDQAASVEPHGFKMLVDAIRTIEAAMGDGVKRVYDSERAACERLRLKDTLGTVGAST